VVKGKACTTYPAVNPDLEQAGATWAEVNEAVINTVVDGNLVTSPAWSAHPEWIKAFLQVLGSTIEP